MLGPLNPANWFKATQSWFTETEFSNGFRPYLGFLLICIPTGLIILSLGLWFKSSVLQVCGVILCVIPILYFIPLFTWKAKTDRDFCRSEKHIQTMKHIELENMGTRNDQIPGNLYEKLVESESDPPIKDPKMLTDSTQSPEQGDKK